MTSASLLLVHRVPHGAHRVVTGWHSVKGSAREIPGDLAAQQAADGRVLSRSSPPSSGGMLLTLLTARLVFF
jgi:hypothetical protein